MFTFDNQTNNVANCIEPKTIIDNNKKKTLHLKSTFNERYVMRSRKILSIIVVLFVELTFVYNFIFRLSRKYEHLYNNITTKYVDFINQTEDLSKRLDESKEKTHVQKIHPARKKNESLKEIEYINEIMKSKNENYIPGRMYIITLADSFKPEICYIASASIKYGYELKILGWNHSSLFFDNTSCGTPCDPNIRQDARHGQIKKIFWIHHFLQNINKQGINDNDLLVFTDAFDVIIQNDLSLIRERFSRQTRGKRGVIFNGEPTCGDSFNRRDTYGELLRKKNYDIQLDIQDDIHTISGKYMCDAISAKTKMHTFDAGPNFSLGSGGFVGDVKTIRSFYENIMKVRKIIPKHEGDQILFQLAYLRYPELNVFIDVRAEIFFVLSYLIQENDFDYYSGFNKIGCLKDYMINGTGSVLKSNRKIPIFFHFPGLYKFLYRTCINNPRKQLLYNNIGKTFYDVDRNNTVPIHSICTEYS